MDVPRAPPRQPRLRLRALDAAWHGVLQVAIRVPSAPALALAASAAPISAPSFAAFAVPAAALAPSAIPAPALAKSAVPTAALTSPHARAASPRRLLSWRRVLPRRAPHLQQRTHADMC